MNAVQIVENAVSLTDKMWYKDVNNLGISPIDKSTVLRYVSTCAERLRGGPGTATADGCRPRLYVSTMADPACTGPNTVRNFITFENHFQAMPVSRTLVDMDDSNGDDDITITYWWLQYRKLQGK